MIGSSCSSANNRASFSSMMGVDVPATILTPFEFEKKIKIINKIFNYKIEKIELSKFIIPDSIAAFLASVLLPILYMTSGMGPTNRMPFCIQALAKSPLSLRNP